MPVNKKSQQRIACLLRLMKEERYPNFPMVLKELRRLDEAGVYKLSQKTIQRDVKYLVEELHAPIQYDAERKGYYLTDRFWSGVPITEEVEMDAAVYGAHLAETLLPPSRIASEIRQGTDALWSRNCGTSEEFAALNSLVARGSSQKVSPDVFQTVFEAWRLQAPVVVKYRRTGDGHVLQMTVEPHVLTLFDNVWYIKGHLRKTDKISSAEKPAITLALHRMLGALRIDGHFQPDQKMIEEVNGGRLFDMKRLDCVEILLRDSSVVWSVEAFPDAGLTKNDDGTAALTLKDIEEYRVLNFMMTSGGKASVLSPEWLREKICGYALAVAKANENQNNQEK